MIGEVVGLYRYPIKSMAGESLDSAPLGWDGLDGDRQHAFRLLDDTGGKPWLIASKLPELVRYTPIGVNVRCPDGRELPMASDELAAELAQRSGRRVQIMRLDHGIFDVASISVITEATLRELSMLCGRDLEARRFRPNLVVRTSGPAFEEDSWVGSVIAFGDGDDAPEIAITQRDERCSMVNIDPDTAETDPHIFKTVVRLRDNYAGAYATVIRTGNVYVGQRMRIAR